MTGFPYRLAASAAPALGLIVLRVDETIEQEFRHGLIPADTRLHVTRIASGDDLTPDSIAAMADGLRGAAALLPGAADFDVVAYACTSGAAQLGPDRVHALVAEGVATRAVTDPLTAGIAMLRDRGVHRVGLVSPYVEAVAAPLRAGFEAAGLNIVRTLSFGEQEEARVARIDPASISEAARHVANAGGCDGLFLSCTNLRTAAILPALEAELGVPVLSSNVALAWHMQRLAAQG